jgi:hypothetical protein
MPLRDMFSGGKRRRWPPDTTEIRVLKKQCWQGEILQHWGYVEGMLTLRRWMPVRFEMLTLDLEKCGPMWACGFHKMPRLETLSIFRRALLHRFFIYLARQSALVYTRFFPHTEYCSDSFRNSDKLLKHLETFTDGWFGSLVLTSVYQFSVHLIYILLTVLLHRLKRKISLNSSPPFSEILVATFIIECTVVLAFKS